MFALLAARISMRGQITVITKMDNNRINAPQDPENSEHFLIEWYKLVRFF
jgi:hypothetical protein